jgi:hypothetical protein
MRMDVDRVGMTLTDQNFQTTVLESPQPVLVAFTAEGMAGRRISACPRGRRVRAAHGAGVDAGDRRHALGRVAAGASQPPPDPGAQ